MREGGKFFRKPFMAVAFGLVLFENGPVIARSSKVVFELFACNFSFGATLP